MARTVEEWRGRTDNTPPSAACKRRILDRQGHVCALTGLPFDDKHKPRFDHRVPLWLGGENRETNLQALREEEAHKPKTAAEAKVRAKVNAVIDKRYDLGRPKVKIQSAGFPKPPAKAPKPLPPRKSIYAPVLWQPGEAQGD
jgi:5-methylcytosine-specific restriction protein A